MTVFNDGTFYYTIKNEEVILGNQTNYVSCPNAIYNSNNINDVLTIPSNVKYNDKTYVIKESTRNSFCYRLFKKVIIPKTYEAIIYASFAYCTELEEVDFEKGNRLTFIDARAFDNCSKLTKIIIPSSVSLIDKNAFSNTNLTQVHYCRSSNLARAAIFSGVKGNIKIYTVLGVYPSSLFGQKRVIFSTECLLDETIKGKIPTCIHRSRIHSFLLLMAIIIIK